MQPFDVILGVLAIVGVGIFLAAREIPKASVIPQEEPLPYRKRTSVFNQSESAFFLELQKQLPPDFYIFPKIRIIDFIAPLNSDYAWRNKIWAKHVDFLVCDQQFRPVLAIELNGGSHLAKDRIERDDFVAKIYRSAELRFETVQVGERFADAITQIVSNLVPQIAS